MAARSPLTIGDRARSDSAPAESRPSQRQLVAWSLLTCPDDRRRRELP
jgi:hypothetical protein